MQAENNKIRLLFITELFPAFEGDMTGIFFLDYISSIQKYAEITVLNARLIGKKGLTVREINGLKVYNYSLITKNKPKLLKPFLYLVLLINSYRAGKKLAKFDLIHSVTFAGSYGAFLGWLLKRKLKVPLVVTENYGPFTDIASNPISRFRAKWILEKADVLTVVSNHLKNEISGAAIHPLKVEITYNPVDVNLFSLKKQNTATAQKKFIFVSRLDENKGALKTVLAFNEIFRENLDWSLTIVGDGREMIPINDFLEKNPDLKKQLNVTGRKTKAEIAQLLRESSFFILPTLFESFGIAIAEAMSVGLPVITGNKTAPVEFVGRESGILINAESVEEIRNALNSTFRL